jgi:hypothetical protein
MVWLLHDTVIPSPGEAASTGSTGQPGDAATSTVPASPSTLERLCRVSTTITTNYGCCKIADVHDGICPDLPYLSLLDGGGLGCRYHGVIVSDALRYEKG